MAEYIEKSEIYKRFFDGGNGIAKIHVADIDVIPPADVAPVVHGRWVNVVCDGYAGEHSGECSHCGERNTFRLPERAHFCSFCGAKMDLEDPQP